MARATTIATTMEPPLRGLPIEVLELWSLRARLEYNETGRHSSSSTLHNNQIDSQHESSIPEQTDIDTEDDGDSDTEDDSGLENPIQKEHQLYITVGIGGSYERFDDHSHYQYSSSDTDTFSQQSSDSDTGDTDKDSDAEAESDALTIIRIQEDKRSLSKSIANMQSYTFQVQHTDPWAVKTTATEANSSLSRIKNNRIAAMVRELRCPGG